MYHTFQTSAAPEPEAAGAKGKHKHNSRRISTTNACIECRRRKIRCDGAQPCGQCQWYQHPQLCIYSKPTQRVVPSRKLLEKLQSQIDQYHSIFSRLFSGQELQTLILLPREELINLAVTLPAPTISPSNDSDPPQSTNRDIASYKSESVESLAALEQAPDPDPEDDEARRHKDRVQSIADDINGLSLSDKQSSYVGISSISAAMKVMFKTAPVARPYIAQTFTDTGLPSRGNSPLPYARNLDPNHLPPADIGHRLIESYFNHVHVLMPMIDEAQFWHTYLYGERRDSSWLALLNMVLALGSLSLYTADNEEHIAYFRRSRKQLDLETFGSGNLLTLQALGLMSGYYLHWLNRPNEANCLMGATLRMATALGLHREYNDDRPTGSAGASLMSAGLEIPAEIRRRTWWSLFILDVWGSTTTGRPSLGRMSPGITVQSPRIPERMNNVQYQASLRLLPIIHNIEFCKLATRIQDMLATRSLCKYEELFSLDAELVKWHDELPPMLRNVTQQHELKPRSSSSQSRARPTPISPTPASASKQNYFDFSQRPHRDYMECPEVLKTPRAIMHWRYQNLRMLIHRPFLLAAVLRRSSYAAMGAEEKVAVGRCRILAGQTIADIDVTCREDLIAGWNGVWMMYQAVMIPLVSLFSHLSSITANPSAISPGKSIASADRAEKGEISTDDDADKWREQIEMAIRFFNRMCHYSIAAKKSREVVERLYEASKHVQQHNEKQLQQQQQQQTFYRQSQPLRPPESYPYGSVGPKSFAGPGAMSMSQLNGQQVKQSVALEPPVWEISPNNEAAMNCFWDDMMWETYPEMPVTNDWVPTLSQHDWVSPNRQQYDSDGEQHWSQWSPNEQQQ